MRGHLCQNMYDSGMAERRAQPQPLSVEYEEGTFTRNGLVGLLREKAQRP